MAVLIRRSVGTKAPAWATCASPVIAVVFSGAVEPQRASARLAAEILRKSILPSTLSMRENDAATPPAGSW
jgi:hypothetical protein